MGYASYPTEEDLQLHLIAAKILPNPVGTSVLQFLRLDVAVAAARRRFEKDAGRVMLAVNGTRWFDGPPCGSAVVNLGSDLASGSSPTVKLGGTTLTLNTDYFLGPANSDGDGRPWGYLELANRYSTALTQRRCLEVTGPWGYATTVPEDAWVAMLDAAVELVMPQYQLGLTQGVIERSEGDVTEKYGSADNVAAVFRTLYETGVTLYRRVEGGI